MYYTLNDRYLTTATTYKYTRCKIIKYLHKTRLKCVIKS